MKTRAAVVVAAGKLLEIINVDLEGPRGGGVLAEVKATGIYRMDEVTLLGGNPERAFPAIHCHAGAAVEAVEVGKLVTSLKRGDHVIPLRTPERRHCLWCFSRKTKLYAAIRATQGQGRMPDGTRRVSIGKDKISHHMGCSTYSHFSVVPDSPLAEANPAAPFDKISFGRAVTTGIGAGINNDKVEPGSMAAVFGLGIGSHAHIPSV